MVVITCHLDSLRKEDYYDDPPLSLVRKLQLREVIRHPGLHRLEVAGLDLKSGWPPHKPRLLPSLEGCSACSSVQAVSGPPPDWEVTGQIGPSDDPGVGWQTRYLWGS